MEQTLNVRLEDGNEYTLSPLTFEDFELLATYFQYQPYNDLKRLGGVTANELQVVLKECVNKPLDLIQFEKALSSFSGTIEMVRLSLVKKHSNLTHQQISRILSQKNQDLLKSISEFIRTSSLPLAGSETQSKN